MIERKEGREQKNRRAPRLCCGAYLCAQQEKHTKSDFTLGTLLRNFDMYPSCSRNGRSFCFSKVCPPCFCSPANAATDSKRFSFTDVYHGHFEVGWLSTAVYYIILTLLLANNNDKFQASRRFFIRLCLVLCPLSGNVRTIQVYI
mmetsp:Transcript_40570/g.60140  ORF Transcript_40570/g.60140 Transcript_40570/m.60140 type:complete len:145 (-) Transcript_40570:1139-1573(-)